MTGTPDSRLILSDNICPCYWVPFFQKYISINIKLSKILKSIHEFPKIFYVPSAVVSNTIEKPVLCYVIASPISFRTKAYLGLWAGIRQFTWKVFFFFFPFQEETYIWMGIWSFSVPSPLVLAFPIIVTSSHSARFLSLLASETHLLLKG